MKARKRRIDLGNRSNDTAGMIFDSQEERRQMEQAAQTLARELGEARGDETQERDAIARAVTRFMEIKRAAGADPKAEPAELMCAEFFAEEGSVAQPPALERVTGATEEDVQRWRDLLADAAGY
jgi:hypothetical protein